MGILDDVERMDKKSIEERLADIEANQNKILDVLEELLMEIRTLKAEVTVPGKDRITIGKGEK